MFGRCGTQASQASANLAAMTPRGEGQNKLISGSDDHNVKPLKYLIRSAVHSLQIDWCKHQSEKSKWKNEDRGNNTSCHGQRAK